MNTNEMEYLEGDRVVTTVSSEVGTRTDFPFVWTVTDRFANHSRNTLRPSYNEARIIIKRQEPNISTVTKYIEHFIRQTTIISTTIKLH